MKERMSGAGNLQRESIRDLSESNVLRSFSWRSLCQTVAPTGGTQNLRKKLAAGFMKLTLGQCSAAIGRAKHALSLIANCDGQALGGFPSVEAYYGGYARYLT